MSTKKKIILLVLVFASMLQQGVRWQLSNRELAPSALVVQAATTPQTESGKPHCALVHINTAGMAELQTLPGIGPIYAERIIIARKEQPFKEKRDLLKISGIGEKRYAQLEDLICLYFEGYAEAK